MMIMAVSFSPPEYFVANHGFNYFLKKQNEIIFSGRYTK